MKNIVNIAHFKKKRKKKRKEEQYTQKFITLFTIVKLANFY